MNYGIIGYRAKRHAGVIDVDKVAAHKTADFWEPLYRNGDNGLVLDPGEFYILASNEAVHVPVDYAAEMVPYDNLVGEFRVHYAGFFDPGFGASETGGEGSKCVVMMCRFYWSINNMLEGWFMNTCPRFLIRAMVLS